MVIETRPGVFAATTRDDGTVGLPGGKAEHGESAYAAALREAREEGWLVTLASSLPIQVKGFNGFTVYWFKGAGAVRLTDYKERARGIRPVEITREQLLASGMGNGSLPI